MSLVTGHLLEWRNAEGYRARIEQLYYLFEVGEDGFNSAVVEEDSKLIWRIKGRVKKTIIEVDMEEFRNKNVVKESRVTVSFIEGGSCAASVSKVFKGNDESAFEQFKKIIISEKLRMT